MNASEMKQALLSAAPVMYDGVRYTVKEIVYRAPRGQIIVSLGLLDGNGNSMVYARPDKVVLCGD